MALPTITGQEPWLTKKEPRNIAYTPLPTRTGKEPWAGDVTTQFDPAKDPQGVNIDITNTAPLAYNADLMRELAPMGKDIASNAAMLLTAGNLPGVTDPYAAEAKQSMLKGVGDLQQGRATALSQLTQGGQYAQAQLSDWAKTGVEAQQGLYSRATSDLNLGDNVFADIQAQELTEADRAINAQMAAQGLSGSSYGVKSKSQAIGDLQGRHLRERVDYAMADEARRTQGLGQAAQLGAGAAGQKAQIGMDVGRAQAGVTQAMTADEINLAVQAGVLPLEQAWEKLKHIQASQGIVAGGAGALMKGISSLYGVSTGGGNTTITTK